MEQSENANSSRKYTTLTFVWLKSAKLAKASPAGALLSVREPKGSEPNGSTLAPGTGLGPRLDFGAGGLGGGGAFFCFGGNAGTGDLSRVLPPLGKSLLVDGRVKEPVPKGSSGYGHCRHLEKGKIMLIIQRQV